MMREPAIGGDMLGHLIPAIVFISGVALASATAISYTATPMSLAGAPDDQYLSSHRRPKISVNTNSPPDQSIVYKNRCSRLSPMHSAMPVSRLLRCTLRVRLGSFATESFRV